MSAEFNFIKKLKPKESAPILPLREERILKESMGNTGSIPGGSEMETYQRESQLNQSQAQSITRVKHSNRNQTIKRQRDINNENKRLLTRLMHAPTSYPKRNWESHCNKYFWSKQMLQTNNKKCKMMLNMKRTFSREKPTYLNSQMNNMFQTTQQDQQSFSEDQTSILYGSQSLNKGANS